MVRFVFASLLLSVICLFAFARAEPAQPKESIAVPQPLVRGEFLSGTLWQKPLTSTSNTVGSSPAAGSRIDVYENFIVVTNAEGIAEISLHGSYTDLKFKPERR